jgi:hypothetical protein
MLSDAQYHRALTGFHLRQGEALLVFTAAVGACHRVSVGAGLRLVEKLGQLFLD